MPRILPPEFYRRKTAAVARELLGCKLVRRHGDEAISGEIVETEAYVGADDPACHGYRNRRTARTESLFQDGGWTYVYFIYGVHWCFNVVTRAAEHPEAVLIRALRPVDGIERMRVNRRAKKNQASPAKPLRDRDLTNGPGKLCQALAIDRSCDRLSLSGPQIWIESRSNDSDRPDVVACARIGVDYAGPAAAWPLRFFIRDDPFVSKRIS